MTATAIFRQCRSLTIGYFNSGCHGCRNIAITLKMPRNRNSECNGPLTPVALGTQGLSVGSRLSEVTDTHSRGIDTRRRFPAILRWVARLVLISIVSSWLFLYIDAVYQRRRAESLFADLKSLDFATAGFPEVREIVTRYGGHGIQRELLPRFPDFGDPLPDEHANIIYPWRGATCTPQDCTFRLWIMTRLPRIPLLDRKARFFYTSLPYIGVRSWVVFAQLDVRNGRLDRSQTGVSEIRMERLDSSGYRYLVPRGYEVETRRDAASFEHSACSRQDYDVYVSHGGFKFPANALETCVVQSAGVSVKRAFDVHLRCLNGLFRSCRFDELAPSAWADYSAKNATGTRDPQK
jgi:hypothetical protein